MFLLRFENVQHCLRFSCGTSFELRNCVFCIVGSPCFQMRKQLAHISRCCRLELPEHNIRNRFRMLLEESSIEQSHCFCLCFTSVGRELSLSDLWIDPSGGHRN